MDREMDRFILFHYLPKMRELITLDDLSLYIRAEGLLTESEMALLQECPPHNSRDRVIQTLATLIKKKGRIGLDRFMSALKKSADNGQIGHKELLQLLEDDRCRVTLAAPPCVIASDEDYEMDCTVNTAAQSGHLRAGTQVIELQPQPTERNEDDPLLPTRSHSVSNDSSGFNWSRPSKPNVLLTVGLTAIGAIQLLIGIGGLSNSERFKCSIPSNVGTPDVVFFVKLFNLVNGLLVCGIGLHFYIQNKWFSKMYCCGIKPQTNSAHGCLFQSRVTISAIYRVTALIIVICDAFLLILTIIATQVLYWTVEDVTATCSGLTFYSAFLCGVLAIIVVVFALVIGGFCIIFLFAKGEEMLYLQSINKYTV